MTSNAFELTANVGSVATTLLTTAVEPARVTVTALLSTQIMLPLMSNAPTRSNVRVPRWG